MRSSMNNDLIPNNGFSLDIPEERKTKESKERIAAKEEINLLKTLLNGIDEKIQLAQNINQLTMNPETSEKSLKVQILAARWRVNDLIEIKSWIKAQTDKVKEND